MAQTPEEIRKKLESREDTETSAGKAVFGAKDIEPAPEVAPREVAPEPEEVIKEEEEPPKPTSGKAVFESKELSNPPPDDK